MNSQSLFDDIYGEHAPRVYAYFALCFGRDTAADLTQQTFTQAWTYLRRGQPPPDNVRAWIFRVAVNVKNDYLRRKQHMPPFLDLDGRGAPAAQVEEDVVNALAVRTAFAQLSAAHREVLLLKQMGLTSEEIARAAGLSSSAVRSRMAAARKQFQRALQDCGVMTDDEDG